MPAQELAQSNPPPDPSLLPDSILDLKTTFSIKNVLSPEELSAIQQYRRAADYIAAGMFTMPTARYSHSHVHPCSYDFPKVEYSHRRTHLSR